MTKLGYCSGCGAVTPDSDLVRIGASLFCGPGLPSGVPDRIPPARGWLLVFAIYYAVIRPLFWILILGDLLTARFTQIDLLTALQLLSLALMTIAGLYVGFRVWSGHRGGKALALNYLYLSIGLLLAMHLPYLGRADSAAELVWRMKKIFPFFLGEMALVAFWIAYFKISQRVRQTYAQRRRIPAA